MPTSSLLSRAGHWAVIDCWRGVIEGIVDQILALKDPGLVFISHLHPDHYLEFGPLIHTAWTTGLKTPVHIWGHAGLVPEGP